jgi:2,3-bisphosphoglycerate-dependent phosphoglycerate mutase
MPDPPITRVLLLRHAETAAPDRFHGAESNVGLGLRGLEQAEAVAPVLAAMAPAALYCSSMARARQTARPIGSACGLEPVLVPELHERRMGPLSGRAIDEVRDLYHRSRDRWKLGDLGATHEGGESYAQIRDRVVPAFIALAHRHPGETIVVVAHGVVIRVLLCSLLEGCGPEDFDRFGIEFVAVNDLRIESEVWRAMALNGLPVCTT